MKIDTAECKRFLEEKFGSGNWKRISKKMNGILTIREFSRGSDRYIVISNETYGITSAERKGTAPLIIERIEDLPQDKKEMDDWLQGEVNRNSRQAEKVGKQGTKKVPADKYLFAFIDLDKGGFFVLINPIAYWKKTGYLSDGYTDKEAKEIYSVTEDMGLDEVEESTFEFAITITKEEATKLLIDRGFIQDLEFSKKMNECN